MTGRAPLPAPQPPAEDLRQIAQIAAGWGANGVMEEDVEDVEKDFAAVMRLVMHALEGLSEPTVSAVRAALPFVCPVVYGAIAGTGVHINFEETDRLARDCAAAVIHAQLKGE